MAMAAIGAKANWTAPWAGVAAVACVGAFLGLAGPFGSFSAGPAAERVFYWTATVGAGTFLYGAAVRRILRCRPPAARMCAYLAAAVVLISAPFSVAVSRAAEAVWPQTAALSALDWYGQVLVISAPLVAVPAAVARMLGRNALSPVPPPLDRLLRVPPREILCLQMEDHYVRVHIAGGSYLVLATLGQAIAALGAVPGLRVHRSWWVAERAVTGAAADGRNLRLRLCNGVFAPVARSSVHAVRAAGWAAERRL